MTIAQLIERVHQKTRRKAEGAGIDMTGVVEECLVEMCMECRWPWRRKTTTFSTVAGTSQYSLNDSAGANAADVEEIISLRVINSASDTPELVLVQDEGEIAQAIADTTRGTPSGYFFVDGSQYDVRLTPVPSAVCSIRMTYWAIPELAETAQTIPLVPVKYHPILQKRCEAEVWSCLPGEGVESPNYVKAMQVYQHRLELAMAKTRISTRQRRQLASFDAVSSA